MGSSLGIDKPEVQGLDVMIQAQVRVDLEQSLTDQLRSTYPRLSAFHANPSDKAMGMSSRHLVFSIRRYSNR